LARSVTTNSGEADAKTATYKYDGFGQAVQSAIFDGTTTQTTVHAYDYAQTPPLLTRVTDPTGAATAYAYDAFDNVSAVTDALGQVTYYGYDALGRLTAIDAPDDRRGRVKCFDDGRNPLDNRAF
jgi:YD repeat-containing protein